MGVKRAILSLSKCCTNILGCCSLQVDHSW